MIDQFTCEQFEKTLSSFGGEWKHELRKGEHIYSAVHGGGRVIISSSIHESGVSKGCGEDSIRVVIEYNGVYKKTFRRWITRVSGWEDRLKGKVIEARIAINELDYSPKCPVCDGAMVMRKGVHGKFYGCLKFPRCRGTRNYEEPEKEFIDIIS